MVLGREADLAGENAGIEIRQLVHRLDEALARHVLAEPLQYMDDRGGAARSVKAEIGELLARRQMRLDDLARRLHVGALDEAAILVGHVEALHRLRPAEP